MKSTAKEINSAVQTACADSTVFENVQSGQNVVWNKGGNKLTGSATEVVKELNTNTFPSGTPAMKSKVWQTQGSYTVTITVSGDSVKISDNAPTVSGKTVN
ncbi:MAG: hypothetical protein PUG04_06880 [Lachnospiraceae bacterium]|nr:hypothetical protein [Lachnospiraceae bacterium]